MESSDIVKELFNVQSEMAQYFSTLTTANSSQQSEDSYADTQQPSPTGICTFLG